MSGPKVVRIVTREELIAISEDLLQQLQNAVKRWEEQSLKLGELSGEERSGTAARVERIRALLAEDRFAELRREVPTEIAFLKRDLAEREQRAIERAAEERRYHRRLQENATTLLKALQSRQDATDPTLLKDLENLSHGKQSNEAEALLAQGFTLLAATPADSHLSEAQRELARKLNAGEATKSLADWLKESPQATYHDDRTARIDRHIAELQLLEGADIALPFLQRLEKAEAETRIQQRNLLLDSLVLDLAEAARLHRQLQEYLAQLRDIPTQLGTIPGQESAELLAQISACQSSRDIRQMASLVEQCTVLIAAHAQGQAARARRQAVLEGLSSLGYEVREGMATAWAESGKVVLRKSSTPGYGVEVGGKAEDGRLQVRAVALSANHDKQRDRDIETIWCGEFQRLQALLHTRGCDMGIERSMAIGAVPLKEVVIDTDEEHRATSAQTVSRQ